MDISLPRPEFQVHLGTVISEEHECHPFSSAFRDSGTTCRQCAAPQTFVQPDKESFRKVLREAGLYGQWRDAYGGAEPFSLLEKAVGKLA